VNDCNKRIVRHELSVVRSSTADDHDDNSSRGGGTTPEADQQIGPETTRPNQGSFLIDSICVLTDIHYLIDLSLLNAAQGCFKVVGWRRRTTVVI